MKNIYTAIIALLVLIQFSYGQNTFPSSGNVGIGTTSPDATFSVLIPSSTGKYATFGRNTTLDVMDLYGNSGTNYIRSGFGDLAFSTVTSFDASNATEKMRILGNGNIGIGTASPSTLLDVESQTEAVTSLVKTGISTGYSQVQVQNDNGANGAFHQVSFGSTFPGTLFGSALANSAALYADGANISGMLIGTKTMTPVTIGTNNTAAITILPDGKIGIGTTNPYNYKLAINGSAIAESVTVKLHGSWPDYVFKPQYNLLSLPEVKAYIDQNQHLPDMPSEQEVKDNGINLGDIVKVQTKKIED